MVNKLFNEAIMHCLHYSQKVPLSLEKCWDFFSTPANLKIMTPAYLGFEMPSDPVEKMYAGQLIEHTVRPICNIPIRWVTEITHVQEYIYFIDEQRFGPYKFWHHEHRFTKIEGGVLMCDLVHYMLPFGPFGKAFHALKVKSDLKKIFSFRQKKLEEIFGPFTIGDRPDNPDNLLSSK